MWAGTRAGPTAAGLADVRHFSVYVIGLMAAVTCTLGNLAAYGQTNMKRLLAYSTVEHLGVVALALGACLLLRQHGADEWASFALAIPNGREHQSEHHQDDQYAASA